MVTRLHVIAAVVYGVVLASPARAQLTAYADPMVVQGSASEPVRVTVRGQGFTDSVQVIVDDIGVAMRDHRRYRAVTDTSFQIALVLGAEAAPWTLRVRNGDSGEPTAPFGIRVEPPVPEITSMKITAPDPDGIRRLSVYSRTATRYTYIVWRGDSVATTPLLTSDNRFAVTLGLAAEVQDGEGGLRDLIEPDMVQIVTPGPGGGVSHSYAAPVAWTPLLRRWQFWTMFLLLLAGAGAGVGLVMSMRTARELQRRVAEQTADLRRSAELRSELFSSVAHDLRTPLTVMLNALDAVMRGGRLEARDRTEMEAAVRAGEKMRRLAGSFVGAAQQASGETELHPVPVDLVRMAQEALAEREAWHDQRSISATVDAETPVVVLADEEAMQRILDNLLDNAYRFTPPGGRIDIVISTDEDNARLTVRDTGPGFPAEFVDRAFEAYTRGPRSFEETSYEGTGMGLAYVRSFAERMGGSVSANPGPGGKVEVRLPLARPPERQFEAVQAPDGDLGPAPARRPRLVLAEDDESLRRQLERHLSDAFEVEAVDDGQAALEAIQRQTPTIVVSDIVMPRLDGLDLVRALRVSSWGESIPIVLVTAIDQPEQVVTAFAAGADDYITKPYHETVLRARIQRLVGGRTDARVPGQSEGPQLSPEDARLTERVRAAVEARLSDPSLTVEELGRDVGLGSAQLTRRMKAAVKQTPAKYIEAVRIDHAAGLLRAGGSLVKEVAGAVGYKDVRTFSRAFRRRFDVNPSDWEQAK